MIRNFIYLDDPKMYSLSSQVFKGVTEYILNENANSCENTEEQKGPITSGRVLADVIKTSNKDIEKRFLHDYSYSLFEENLIENKKVLTINTGDSIDRDLITNKFSFVRIKSVSTLTDVKKITDFFENFNELGKAVTYASFHEKFQELETELNEFKETKSKKEFNTLSQEFKKRTNIASLAKEAGFYQNPEFLKSLVLLIKYGFSDQFQIQQSCDDLLFTSSLKREFLRESEEMLINKYSSKTEKEFVILGLVTQTFANDNEGLKSLEGDDNLKTALMEIVDGLSEVEVAISGIQGNEIIIDPIAVYTEL